MLDSIRFTAKLFKNNLLESNTVSGALENLFETQFL